MIVIHKDGKGVSLKGTNWSFNIRRVSIHEGKKIIFAVTAGYYDRIDQKYKDFDKVMWQGRDDLDDFLNVVFKLLDANLPKPAPRPDYRTEQQEL